MTIEAKKGNFNIDFFAAVSTYLTLSYVFILNPILLNKIGIDISAAFFSTVVAAAIGTFFMGWYAKVPFAVASAPSITTFLVGYVCTDLGLSWQAAMGAVVVSGALSLLMTKITVRKRLIDSISTPLRVGIVFAVSGFLIANGLSQSSLVSYQNGFLDISALSASNFISYYSLILLSGLGTTLLFRHPKIYFSGAPLLGILAATLVALFFDIKSNSKAEFSLAMFSTIGKVDFSPFTKANFIISILIFFIIDFFSGIGKYVGLFTAMGQSKNDLDKKGIDKALYVDSGGNILGGLLGASSLAVFVSSAVGIAAGGKTGRTAIIISVLMLCGLVLIPLVGAVPVQATSGILIYIAFLLIPVDKIIKRKNAEAYDTLTDFDLCVCFVAAAISLLTYGIDKAILFVFIIYTLKIAYQKSLKESWILIVTTLLLGAAVVFSFFS